jgi:hypothetical protein
MAGIPAVGDVAIKTEELTEVGATVQENSEAPNR